MRNYNGRKVNLAEMRQAIIHALRGRIRNQGQDPNKVGADYAIAMLDDISRSFTDVRARNYYLSATEAQLKKFRADWTSIAERMSHLSSSCS